MSSATVSYTHLDPNIENIDGFRVGVEKTVEQPEHHAPHDVCCIDRVYRSEGAFADVNKDV